ncbi:MAG: undecaprenyl-diphosphate phosphatase [Dehalococcoidia bacterium]|nr:undecaprenyl-diphosphate phosphatase [Dehalococcoidia bacterium]
MDEYLRAIFLGALQAPTEFLPISSSAHLFLAERLLGERASSLTFDVGLHTGTLLAVLLYFRAEWFGFARALVVDVTSGGGPGPRWSIESRLLLAIAWGTLPAVAAGYLLNDAIDAYARSVSVIVGTLIGFGVLLEVADRRPEARGLGAMTYAAAFLVGMGQAIALVPGVSRSGVTISAARALGFDRGTAARFSFLLSAPVVFAAAVLELGYALVSGAPVAWGPMLAGAATAAIVGWFVIAGLLSFLRTRSLRVFVWYRIALGLAVLAGAAMGAL